MRLTKLERAVTDTLDMYERLIADPLGVIDEWRNQECRVCTAMGTRLRESGCPFDMGNAYVGCMQGTDGNFKGSKMAIRLSITSDEIKMAAKDRYDVLLKRMKLNGWEYK